VGHESGDIDIWDIKQALSKRTINAHGYRANVLAFNRQGDAFFSNSNFENETKLWDAETGKLVTSIPFTSGPVCGTSDERFYIIANSDQLRIFDYRSKTLLRDTYRFSYDVVTQIAYDNTSDRIAVGTASGTVQILQFSIDNDRPKLQMISRAAPYGMGNWVIGLQFADEGRKLYSVARQSYSVDEWEVQPLQIKHSHSTTLQNIASAAFMFDQGLFVLAGARTNPFAPGLIEIHSLSAGKAWMFEANTNLPVVEILSPTSLVISAQQQSAETYNFVQGQWQRGH
jgi:WD40 repeat protein